MYAHTHEYTCIHNTYHKHSINCQLMSMKMNKIRSMRDGPRSLLPRNTAWSVQQRVIRSIGYYHSLMTRRWSPYHHRAMRLTDHHVAGTKRQLKPNTSPHYLAVRTESGVCSPIILFDVHEFKPFQEFMFHYFISEAEGVCDASISTTSRVHMSDLRMPTT